LIEGGSEGDLRARRPIRGGKKGNRPNEGLYFLKREEKGTEWGIRRRFAKRHPEEVAGKKPHDLHPWSSKGMMSAALRRILDEKGRDRTAEEKIKCHFGRGGSLLG